MFRNFSEIANIAMAATPKQNFETEVTEEAVNVNNTPQQQSELKERKEIPDNPRRSKKNKRGGNSRQEIFFFC